MRVLITGHVGFVGRRFWRVLSEQGHHVTGVDIRPLGRAPACGPVELNHGGDVLRRLLPPGARTTYRTRSYARTTLQEDAREFFRSNTTHYDLVVHLAAVVGGRATIEGDPLAVAADLAIDAEMFQWAMRTRPGRIVYYSSSAAYPVDLQTATRYVPDTSMIGKCRDFETGWPKTEVPNRRALREDDINLDRARFGVPDLTYGWAKLTGEMLARHAEGEGLRVHVFRPFSGYAADQDLDYPFPSFVDRAHRRADPFQVWGDGTQCRDWIHIDDVVAGTLAAVDQDVPGPVNLCTGRATSFNELADLVTEAAGYRPQIEHVLDAPRGVAYRVGDPTRLHEFYRPRIDLEEGIARALAD